MKKTMGGRAVILYKIISLAFSYVAIGIAVVSFINAVENEEVTNVDIIVCLLWPLMLPIGIFCYGGHAIKFLSNKMTTFWKSVLSKK